MAPPPAQAPMEALVGGASAGRRYSFVARARASLRSGHRRGSWLHPLCYPRGLCGCCAPRTAATSACNPSTWRQCGECVRERVRGSAVWTDVLPTGASFRRETGLRREGCGGATWHPGTRGDADAAQGTPICRLREGCEEVRLSRTLAAAEVAAV